MPVNLAQVTVVQNEEMRKISACVGILAVPGFGAELRSDARVSWRYGYPMALGLIGICCLLLYRGFRRNSWL